MSSLEFPIFSVSIILITMIDFNYCQQSVCWPIKKGLYVSVISNCMNSNINDNLKELCENPEIIYLKIIDYIPVYQMSNVNVLYRNRYCAECNQVNNYKFLETNGKVKCKKPLKSDKIINKKQEIAQMIFNQNCDLNFDYKFTKSLTCNFLMKTCGLNNEDYFNSIGFIKENSIIKWYKFDNIDCCRNHSKICITSSRTRSSLYFYTINALIYEEITINSEIKSNSTSNSSLYSLNSESFFVYSLHMIATTLSLFSAILLIGFYSAIKSLYTSTSFMIVAIGVNIAFLETVDFLMIFFCKLCQINICEYFGILSIYFHISETICICNYISSFWYDINQMRTPNINNQNQDNYRRNLGFFASSILIPFSLCGGYLITDKYNLFYSGQSRRLQACTFYKIYPLLGFYLVPVLLILIITTVLCLKICFHLRSSIALNNDKHQCKNHQRFLIGLKLCFISGINWIFNLLMCLIPNKIVLQCGIIISHFNGFVIVVCFLSSRSVRKFIIEQSLLK